MNRFIAFMLLVLLQIVGPGPAQAAKRTHTLAVGDVCVLARTVRALPASNKAAAKKSKGKKKRLLKMGTRLTIVKSSKRWARAEAETYDGYFDIERPRLQRACKPIDATQPAMPVPEPEDEPEDDPKHESWEPADDDEAITDEVVARELAANEASSSETETDGPDHAATGSEDGPKAGEAVAVLPPVEDTSDSDLVEKTSSIRAEAPAPDTEAASSPGAPPSIPAAEGSGASPAAGRGPGAHLPQPKTSQTGQNQATTTLPRRRATRDDDAIPADEIVVAGAAVNNDSPSPTALRLDLQPPEPVMSPAQAAQLRLAAWASLGAGAAGLLVGGILGGVAWGMDYELSTNIRAYARQPIRSEAQERELTSRRRNIEDLYWSAGISGAAGLLAATAGTILYLLTPTSTGDAATPVEVDAPNTLQTHLVVAPNGVMLSAEF